MLQFKPFCLFTLQEEHLESWSIQEMESPIQSLFMKDIHYHMP